jgi:membrane associated rhomboid family serine protease
MRPLASERSSSARASFACATARRVYRGPGWYAAPVLVPMRGDVPARSAPIAVAAITALDVVAFFYLMSLAPSEATSLVDRYGLVPREFVRALAHPVSGSERIWLTPLTSMFLHGDALHLAGNLLYLWVFGTQIEDLLGHARFGVFYLACGIAAALLHVASAPGSYLSTLGASGAISGLLGAYAVSYPTGRLRLLWPSVRVPALLFLFVWIALQLASGIQAYGTGSSGVAWWAHVGGFGAGAVLARAMAIRPPARSRSRI